MAQICKTCGYFELGEHDCEVNLAKTNPCNLFTKEDFKMFARLCGYEYRFINREWLWQAGEDTKPSKEKRIRFDNWRPDRYIEQAMLLAECAQKYGVAELVIFINSGDWVKYIDDNFKEHILPNNGATLQQLICRAVKEGWATYQANRNEENLFEMHEVVRYGDGPTALMQITQLPLAGASGNGNRYYGNQIYGGSVGAYEVNMSKANRDDLALWIKQHTFKNNIKAKVT